MKAIQTVKINPKDTVQCLCILDKLDELIMEDCVPHDFIKGKKYACAKYEDVNGDPAYTVIYKSDDYEERIEGTKFFVTKGGRSSHFLNEEEFSKYFTIDK